jgi:hypothetical protein
MSCAVCLRDHRGPQFADPIRSPFQPPPIYRACSMGHLDVIVHFWSVGEMLNPTQHEEKAVLVASDAAGEYLEGLGKFDLQSLSSDEWLGLVRLIFEASTKEVGRLTDEQAVPF